MVSANNYTAGYAEALVLGTPKDQLAQPEKPKVKDERIVDPGNLEKAISEEADITEERARRQVATPHIGEAKEGEPVRLSLKEVKTKIEYRKTIETLKMIFKDPKDLDTDKTLARLFYDKDICRYNMLQDQHDKTVGMQQIRINPNVPDAAYTPYGGLIEGYKGINLYPNMVRLGLLMVSPASPSTRKSWSVSSI